MMSHFLLQSCLTIFILLAAHTAFAQRDLKDIPDPDPELERKTFVVPEGFEVNLYAGDPLMAKPIQMNFDAEGKLWIASSETYPHIKPGEEPHDKILVLEDTDHDGKVDKTTVFADDLLIPTGVLPGDGGCYVANSTDLLFLKDTNGDGKADVRREVLSGFGTEDTHHLLHTLRWGVEGALYMNQSIYIHSHVETPHGVKRLNGGGIWRFRPDTMQLDIFCRGFVNPWGHHQDRWGQSFATDGAYGEGINYVFPGAIYVTAPGEKRRLEGLNPGSPKHCSLEITSGTHLPEEWRGNMITNDFRAHRVCRFVVTEDGSGYSSRQEVEVIKSTHPAFRPIDVKMGPDGAIYIADWYNPIIQHGEVDFRDPRRDHVHGRIWRVSAKDRPLVKRTKIVGASIEELLEMLKAEEDWVRLWAKRELKKHDSKEVAAATRVWLKGLDPKSLAYGHQQLEALWACQTVKESGDFPLLPDQDPLNSLIEDLLGILFKSEDHRVRAAVVRAATFWPNNFLPHALAQVAAAEDKHPRVRLEGVRAIANSKSPIAAEVAAQVLDQPMDRFLDFALWQAMRDLEPNWLPALQKGEIDFGGNVEHLTFALKAVDAPQIVPLLLDRIVSGDLPPKQLENSADLIIQLGTPEELHRLFAFVAAPDSKLDAKQRANLLASLALRSETRGIKPAGDLSALGDLLRDEDSFVQIYASWAAGVWKVVELRGEILKMVASPDTDAGVRLGLLQALNHYGDAQSKALLLKIAKDNEDTQQGMAMAWLCELDVKLAASLIADSFGADEEPQYHATAVFNLLRQKNGASLLAAAIENRSIPEDFAKRAIRAAREAPGDTSELQTALRAAGGLTEGPKKYSAEEIAALVADVKAKGDPHRGEAIYRRREMQCLNCHAIGGSGGKVGPDMISIGASAPIDYLLESLVDPNAKVKENFHSIIVETDAGKVHSGIPVQRSAKQLVLRDQHDNEVTIPVESIDAEREGRSLMPEGLAETLTRDELIDLTAFLSQLGKDGDFSVGKEPVVRTWRKLIYTDEGHRRLNRTSHDTAATDDPALIWEPAYSQVSGELSVDENLHAFEIHRGHPPVSFVRFDLEVTTAGEIELALGETEGLTLWVDEKPTQVATTLNVSLPTGKHTMTLAIDRTKRKDPLRIEVAPAPSSTGKAALIGGK